VFSNNFFRVSTSLIINNKWRLWQIIVEVFVWMAPKFCSLSEELSKPKRSKHSFRCWHNYLCLKFCVLLNDSRIRSHRKQKKLSHNNDKLILTRVRRDEGRQPIQQFGSHFYIIHVHWIGYLGAFLNSIHNELLKHSQLHQKFKKI